VEEMLFEEKNFSRESRHFFLEDKVLDGSTGVWDNGHLMFYTHKTWTDSNIKFCKCWQECEVIGIHTNVNSGNRLIVLHIGGIGGFLPLCISHLQG
jgi:hypothetical protein